MKKQVKDSERVQPSLHPKSRTITVSVKRENNTTTVDNGLGQKWKLKNISTGVGIAMLIADTLETRHQMLTQFCNKFEITLTIEEIVF